MIILHEPYQLDVDDTSWICEATVTCGGVTRLLTGQAHKIEPPLTEAKREAMLLGMAENAVREMRELYNEAYPRGMNTPNPSPPDTMPENL